MAKLIPQSIGDYVTTNPINDISKTTISLLKLAKDFDEQNQTKRTWIDIRYHLSDLYLANAMTLVDVVQVVARSHQQLLDDSRFDIGDKDNNRIDLILAPIRGPSSVELLGASRIDNQYSVEDYYNAILRKMMSDFSIARIDWLVNETIW